MERLIFLHTADIHLGAKFPRLGPFEEERKRDVEETFQRILRLCLTREVDALLVAGDWFDGTNPEPQLVEWVGEEIKPLKDAGVAVLAVPGNHDHVGSRLFANPILHDVHFFSEPLLKEPQVIECRGGVFFAYGIAHHFGHPVEEMIATLRRRETAGTHIGLLHCSVIENEMWRKNRNEFPVLIETLRELGLDYLALGNYHERKVFVSEDQKIFASYSGSPEGKRFGENGPRYCHLVSVGEEGVSLEAIAIQSRELVEKTINVSHFGSIEQIENLMVSKSHPSSMVRLKLEGIWAERNGLLQLKEKLQSRFAYTEIEDRTFLFEAGMIKGLAEERSIRGFFVKNMLSCMDQEPEKKLIFQKALNLVLAKLEDETK